VTISGAKNAALPLICASILSDTPVTFFNVPLLDDVRIICDVLRSMGAGCDLAENGRLEINPTTISRQDAPYELVRKMRASFLVMGPLLAKFGRGEVPLPGGCNIGPRPVDEHLMAFAELGAAIDFRKGVVYAAAEKLTGSSVNFNISSVGATENVLMAAALADGVTVLENCAEEPEVHDLVDFLRSLGADIILSGPRRIEVRGVKKLRQIEAYSIIPDRIEAGTYLLAAVGTGGDVKLTGCRPSHMTSLIEKLRDMGARIATGENMLHVQPAEAPLSPVNVRTQPYPGFPTDLQPQMSTVLTRANGMSIVTETIFEQRFSYVPELQRMGAAISQQENSAIIDGAKSVLTGAPVEGYDLRGAAALTIAGLIAQGESLIAGYGHMARGYEKPIDKLNGLGADVRLVDRSHKLKNNNGNGNR
jgi:UDP-N-acetylglucosamine 1-carboxyvinyltransferase